MGPGILPETTVGKHNPPWHLQMPTKALSCKKVYVNMIQKRRRVLWAKAHLKLTVSKWKNVLWSDESKFDILVQDLFRTWNGTITLSIVKKAQQRLYFLRQLRKFNLPRAAETVLLRHHWIRPLHVNNCLVQLSYQIWHQKTMEGSPDCWANHWYNPPYSPRTVLIQSEKKGWQNHSGPLTSSTPPLWTVTV